MTSRRQSDNPGVLVVNPGSSSLKWGFFNSLEAARAVKTETLAPDEGDRMLRRLLDEYTPGLVVIRFVHGGTDFVTPLWITRDNLQALSALEAIAPLHNPASLECIHLLLEAAPDATELVAVFDTEFFHGLPRVSRLYGLPAGLQQKHGIRRFGFHGFAHRGMSRAWESLRISGEAKRLVTMQLGSGCSMSAILAGRPLDTTMGFTPNEGLLMSTRSGDIDPGLVTWLQRREGWGPDETDRILNEHSGWLGMSGESADMADLLASESQRAGAAVELFRHRIRKTLGAYYALLGGLDGIVAGGGIAEHAPFFVREILGGLEHLGIELADETSDSRPAADPGPDGAWRFSAPGSAADCWCIRVDEHRSMLDSVSEHMQSDSDDI